jgi:alkylation response protein AidB-like acyl-CoA dehydrogenase
MAKWWCKELQQRAVDRGLQLHGGYGYTGGGFDARQGRSTQRGPVLT